MADYDIPQALRYTREDEWIRIEGERIVIGVTDYAQQQLGDIVFVELPKVGASLAQGATFGVVESVKAVSDLYCPLSGKVVEVNAAVLDTPSSINEQPYDAGWLIKVELSTSGELDALRDSAAYETLVALG